MSDVVLKPVTDRLMAHLGEFAKRIKLSGTPEELESFRYLESEMAGYGYRTELLFHDAYISLPGTARVSVDGSDIACITHSMSVPTPAAGLSAPLVYLREGEAADFAAVDVRGKIVLVDGITTEEVAALSRDAGALGQLHISPTEHLYEMCVSPVWGSPSQHTRGQLPTTAICTISRDDGAKLRERCLKGETIIALLQTQVDTGWRKTPILVCEMEAPHAVDGKPFVMFSGHHDTWHYGVMDNGGANATMLEAARLLAEQNGQWRRGLRICFWSGHSHGRYSGSAWYADEFFDDLARRCAAHVNVDSTGGEGASVLANCAVIDELKGVAADAIGTVTGQTHAGRRHGRAADQSFWGVGIPSMFGSLSHQPPGPVKMLAPLGWWWHTPHDTIEHIDPQFLTRDTEIVLRVLWRLLTAPVLPLDYTAYATSLQAALAVIKTGLAGRMDISLIDNAAAALAETAQRIGEKSSTASAQQADRINAALVKASRLLVPLNYTSGERFHHDPALPHLPWPSLAGLRDLAGLPAGSDDTLFYAVHARQTRNRVAHALQEATSILSSAL
jgi:hypothetical protein